MDVDLASATGLLNAIKDKETVYAKNVLESTAALTA